MCKISSIWAWGACLNFGLSNWKLESVQLSFIALTASLGVRLQFSFEGQCPAKQWSQGQGWFLVFWQSGIDRDKLARWQAFCTPWASRSLGSAWECRGVWTRAAESGPRLKTGSLKSMARLCLLQTLAKAALWSEPGRKLVFGHRPSCSSIGSINGWSDIMQAVCSGVAWSQAVRRLKFKVLEIACSRCLKQAKKNWQSHSWPAGCGVRICPTAHPEVRQELWTDFRRFWKVENVKRLTCSGSRRNLEWISCQICLWWVELEPCPRGGEDKLVDTQGGRRNLPGTHCRWLIRTHWQAGQCYLDRLEQAPAGTGLSEDRAFIICLAAKTLLRV